MAKEEKSKDLKEKKPKKLEIRTEKIIDDSKIIRITSTDIPGSKKILVGLTYIKGISWAMSNAICNVLKIDNNRKILSLTKDEIQEISDFIKNPKVPSFLMNRRKDRETGESAHLITSDLDIKKEFDIKRHKKIRSYRGIRHMLGQPVRGQRTKSHFRKNKTVGVMKKSVAKNKK
jgi:small subunit ribosomal protein S13